MKLVDEVKFKACAGKGGDGIVSWLRLKFMPKGGPAGGDGGDGGSVYAVAVKDITALRKYLGKDFIKAGDGKNGMSRGKHGVSGEDLVLEFPVGSVLHIKKDDGTEKKIELLEIGKKVLILKGGKGGLGNINFKSSRNRTPKKATKGKVGECAEILAELHVIADAGFVGLPNAGKSSALNSLAQRTIAKVGSYPFTTIEPNLLALDGYTIADLPGLIEDASKGKGLGIKFLKHVSRVKLLVHFISAENKDPKQAYLSIRKELEEFDKSLTDKKELIVISKIDLVDNKRLNDILDELRHLNKDILAISVNQPETIDALKKTIMKTLGKMQ